MPDFNVVAPDKKTTDPNNLAAAGAVFPTHVHRYVADKTESSLVVAWKGKTPIHNEYLSVASEQALADALAEGYSRTPVTDAPKADAAEDAAEPATEPVRRGRKPKADAAE